jgi:predicted patatin/cPLA2 family phospholipase
MAAALNEEPLSGAALLIEGGGLRGAFGAGVVAELAGRGAARFDDVIAVSSGAPTAAYLAAGQIEDALRIWEDHTHGAQLISPWNWLRGTPLLDVDGLVRVFDRQVPLDRARLHASATRCWVLVTHCETGRAELVRATESNALELLRATMAMPVAYGKVVDVEGVPYVDGGVADAVPIERALDFRRERTVVVLTQPRGYRRERRPALFYLMGKTYPRYPALARALAARADTANAALARIEDLERRGLVSVIRPAAPLPAGRLSTRRGDIRATIEAGRDAARAWLAVSQPAG